MRGSETRLCCRIAATRLCLASSLTLSRLLLPSSSLALSSSSSRLTPFPILPHPSAPSSSRAPASPLPPSLSPPHPLPPRSTRATNSKTHETPTTAATLPSSRNESPLQQGGARDWWQMQHAGRWKDLLPAALLHPAAPSLVASLACAAAAAASAVKYVRPQMTLPLVSLATSTDSNPAAPLV
ncbi:unnamed protein product [Closterium sp. Naga37s-1]|nr:unnamed protein product [Closterium sp. Naga37s-1]